MSLVRMVEKSLMEGLPVLLHFPRFSLNEWISGEGLLHTKEDDILKQSQAFLSIRWLSASSCSDPGSLTMETAMFVKSHLKKWLLSLPRGAKNSVNLVNLVILDLLSFLSGWAGARRAAFLRTFCDGIGEFQNGTNGKWPPRETVVSFNWNLSLRKSLLERWGPGVFSVPVYKLLKHSLTRFQMWTFHFALNASFSIGFWNGLLPSPVQGYRIPDAVLTSK